MVVLASLDFKVMSNSITEEVRVRVSENLIHSLLEELHHVFPGHLLFVWEEATREILSDIYFGDFNCLEILQLVAPSLFCVLSGSFLEPVNVCPKTRELASRLWREADPDGASASVAEVLDIRYDQTLHLYLHIRFKFYRRHSGVL